MYADEHLCAYLDIHSLSRGNTRMIPHWRYEWLDRVCEDVGVVLGGALRRISQAVMLATGATAYNVLQNHGAAAGQEVPHVHFHLISQDADGLDLPRH